MKKIGACCFEKSGLEEIVLPASVKEIGARAFYYCKQLKNVQLNEGLEKLGSNAFTWSAITSVRIPSTLKRIENETF